MDFDNLLKTGKIAALYADIGQRPLTFEKSKDDGWGANVEADRIVINYAETSNPEPCLAHELLHVSSQLKGYRRVRFGISSFDGTGWLGQFITAMDNELQHHRMFPRFVEVGFKGDEFYGETQAEIATHLNRVLKDRDLFVKRLVLEYLTVIAPGGTLTEQQRADFKQRFHKHSGRKFGPILREIDDAFADWSHAPNWNAEPTWRRVFRAIAQASYLTWFGYTKDPKNGFFIEKEFEFAPM